MGTVTAPLRIVEVATQSEMFGAYEGRTAEVVADYWRNGEGWFTLRDGDVVFDSPDVFWQERT